MAYDDRRLKRLGRQDLAGSRENAMDCNDAETGSAIAHFVTRAGKNRGKFLKHRIGALCVINEAALEVLTYAARV